MRTWSLLSWSFDCLLWNATDTNMRLFQLYSCVLLATATPEHSIARVSRSTGQTL